MNLAPARFLGLALACWVALAGIPVPAAQGARDPSEKIRLGLSKTIFLDLRDINVVDVIKFLGLEGDLNIVTSKNVQGRSTLLLREVTIRDALDIICISNQLAYDIKNNIIYVMTEEEYQEVYGKAFNDKRKILTRKLKYAKPSYIQSALQSMLSSIGKVIIDEETGTVLILDTHDRLAEMDAMLDVVEKKLDTQVVKLQYADAKELETQLQTKLDAKSVGTIFGDTRSNQMVLSAYPGRMEEILPIIRSLDAQTKAVLIETRILQLTLNPKFDYGIDWEKTFTKSAVNKELARNIDLHGSFPISSTVSTSTTLGTATRFLLGNITDDEILLELKAIKQVTNSKVLANPRLMVLDRQEAKINIGDRIPYVVTTSTGSGSSVTVSEEINFIDVGIQVTVTPTLNANGYVTMKIRPEISSKTGVVTTSQKNEIPLVNTTYVESTVVVLDGNTVILGGLRRDDMSETIKGFPYLMDVPVLGNLFKSRAEEAKKSEIVMFLTPKIVTGAEQITDEPFDIAASRQTGRAAQNISDPAGPPGWVVSTATNQIAAPEALLGKAKHRGLAEPGKLEGDPVLAARSAALEGPSR